MNFNLEYEEDVELLFQAVLREFPYRKRSFSPEFSGEDWTYFHLVLFSVPVARRRKDLR